MSAVDYLISKGMKVMPYGRNDKYIEVWNTHGMNEVILNTMQAALDYMNEVGA